jgi:hypothetical protein
MNYYVWPRYRPEIDMVHGYRACAPAIPGLVFVHKEEAFARKMIVTALEALRDEHREQDERSARD